MPFYETVYRVALNFCGFFRDPQKKVLAKKKKKTAKNFPAKIYFNVDILMVDIDYGIERDSEVELGYRLEYENTIDNSLDNASSGKT